MELRIELLKPIAEAGFADRYYAFCDTHPLNFSGDAEARGGRHSLEMIVAVKCKHGGIGETYHGLAHDIARLLNPAVERSPPYPKIHLSKVDGLEQAIDFGVSLFRLAKGAVLTYEGGDALFSKEPP